MLNISSYPLHSCDIGVVHVGFGAFHRAHQAWYIDKMMDKTQDLRWGIVAVNLQSEQSQHFAHITQNLAQDGSGYVVKTMSTNGDVGYECIRAHVQCADWHQHSRKTEELLALPSVHMVTITVTESGYYNDDKGALDLLSPMIAQEIAGGQPQTIYAFLRAGLQARKQSGGKPLTVVSCDNIRDNGMLLETNVRSYLAAMGDSQLLEWLDSSVSFPCTMVDRITPQPTAQHTDHTNALLGRKDPQTIIAEDYIQWVVEDKFAGQRPPLETVGVKFTSHVRPYEEAKLRILNGGHTAVAYLAALHGCVTFDEAMRQEHLFAHFWDFETREVLPALTIPLDFDKHAYLETIKTRFLNSYIGDTVERICADGFAKFPVFILPTIQSCFALGIVPHCAIKSIASWYIFARRVGENALEIHYHEPNMRQLAPLLKDGCIADFIGSQLLWQNVPEQFPRFADLFIDSVKEVESLCLV